MERHLPHIVRQDIRGELGNLLLDSRFPAEHSQEWEYTAEIAKLHNCTESIVDRFFPNINTPLHQGKLPTPHITVESLRNRKSLAAYRVVPDDHGLIFKLTFNKQHYIEKTDGDGSKRKIWRFGQWAQMETLVHELGHHWQQLLGQELFEQNSRVSHNKEFRMKLAQLGLHCTGEGYHDRLADTESPFGYLMREWAIEPPQDAQREMGFDRDWFKVVSKDRERKGRSTLTKYTCACGQNIRVGRQNWPGAVCNGCGSQYEAA